MNETRSEYIDLDTPLEVYVERGVFCKKQIASLRELLDTNKIPYTAADVRPVVTCSDCKWWTKQEASLQGRCELLKMYPTGAWFCANGKREEN